MSMRITNGMMIDSFLINMQNNMQKMDRYTQQLASNRKMVRLSDDPVGVLNALTARQRLQRFEQYQSNLVTARNWVEQADTTLQEMSAKTIHIREEIIYAASGAKTNEDRQNIASLTRELRDHLKDALNTTLGEQHVFAGYNTTNAPLTVGADGKILYNGLDMSDTSPANLDLLKGELAQQVQIEVGFSLNMDVTVNALSVLGVGDDNFFKVLDDVIALMEDPDIAPSDAVAQLSAKLEQISIGHNRITTSLVRVGSMLNRIDMLEDRYSQDIINYNEIRSRIEDIDSAEVIMDWKMAQAVYEQSLSTGARVIMPTLMDFLR